jgi:DNA-directed RNA polymerase, mitochondrial
MQELALALLAPGPITRKIIKQTVMTSVYGVTWMGGRDQIMKQLKVRVLVLFLCLHREQFFFCSCRLLCVPSGRVQTTHDFRREQLFNASSYLVTCVFHSLDEMFSQANAIKEWLSQTARVISMAGEPVTWVTPLGLPVIQPYHKPKRHSVRELAIQDDCNVCHLLGVVMLFAVAGAHGAANGELALVG